jgi:hypothetical protein
LPARLSANPAVHSPVESAFTAVLSSCGGQLVCSGGEFQNRSRRDWRLAGRAQWRGSKEYWFECFFQLETLVLLRPQAGEEARHEPEISNEKLFLNLELLNVPAGTMRVQ